jgi:exodeoxyribonuclease VII small subunit
MKEVSFEEAVTELDGIVKRLESGNAPLEESLKEYERAIELVKVCNEKLSSAEKKLTVLTGEENGDETIDA